MTICAALSPELQTWWHVARGLVRCLTHGPRYAWTEYRLAELEGWLAECREDGLDGSLHIAACRDELAVLRVELAAMAPPLRRGA
jgi:hypothetical protein